MEWRVDQGLEVIVPDELLETVERVVGGAGLPIDSYRDILVPAHVCGALAPALEAARDAAEERARDEALRALGLSRPTEWAEPRLRQVAADDVAFRTFGALAELCRLAASDHRALEIRGRG